MTLLKKIYSLLFVERRLPYTWSENIHNILYKPALDKCLASVLATKPIPCHKNTNTELHLVTCKRDIYMAILAIKSFLRFYSEISVVIHGDETLDGNCKKELSTHIPNVTIIDYDYSMKSVSPEISALREQIKNRFKLDDSFERQRKAWALKVFDFHLFSNTEKIIVLDSDTLFLKKPTEIIDWIKNETVLSFHAQPYLPNLMFDEGLSHDILKNKPIIKSFNGGLFGFSKTNIPVSDMFKLAHNLITKTEIPLFGDECIWRLAYSQVNHQTLEFNKYPLFGTLSRFKQFKDQTNDFNYIHFLLKHRHGIYKKFAQSVISELK